MGPTRLLCIFAATFILAACTSSQQGATPAVTGATPTPGATGALETAGAAGHNAGHLMLTGGIRPDKECPHQFVYCVTLSPHQSAQLYFCYSTGSYCGSPSQPQYYWQWWFYSKINGQWVDFFNGSFNPNPGNPSIDTISEAYGVGSTHGKYKYEQIVCPYLAISCLTYFYIGIATK